MGAGNGPPLPPPYDFEPGHADRDVFPAPSGELTVIGIHAPWRHS